MDMVVTVTGSPLVWSQRKPAVEGWYWTLSLEYDSQSIEFVKIISGRPQTWKSPKGVNYAIARPMPGGLKWWWQWWTPAWHDGRGPYISIGCGFFTLMRGY